MLRVLLALGVLAEAVVPCQAQLALTQVKVLEGPFGRERRDLDYYPGEEFWVRCLLMGTRFQPDGYSNCSAKVTFRDAGGRVVTTQETPVVQPRDGLTGGVGLQVSGRLGPELTPGPYILDVTLRDHLSSGEAGFTRQMTIKPITGLAIVSPCFYYDANGGGAGAVRWHRRPAAALPRARLRLRQEQRQVRLRVQPPSLRRRR